MIDNEKVLDVIEDLECELSFCKAVECNTSTVFVSDLESYLDVINGQKAEIEDLNKSRNGLLRKCVSAYHEGIKYFAKMLCDDRVSNDPVVIAVKAGLKEMVGEG